MDWNWLGSTIFQNVILIVTVACAVSIGFRQNQINQNIQEENVRPVILRAGFINNWSDLQRGLNNEVPLMFSVQRNIALDVQGYVIIENKKYNLVFNIATPTELPGKYTCQIQGPDKLGWVKQDGVLCASFNPSKFVMVPSSKNEIYLTYKDVQGGTYFTQEDSDFQQTAGKVPKTQ